MRQTTDRCYWWIVFLVTVTAMSSIASVAILLIDAIAKGG